MVRSEGCGQKIRGVAIALGYDQQSVAISVFFRLLVPQTKTGYQTDQSNACYTMMSPGNANLIGQSGFSSLHSLDKQP